MIKVLIINWGEDVPENAQFEDQFRIISYTPDTKNWCDWCDLGDLINSCFIPQHNIEYDVRTLNADELFIDDEDEAPLREAAIRLCEHLADPECGPTKQQLNDFNTCFSSECYVEGVSF